MFYSIYTCPVNCQTVLFRHGHRSLVSPHCQLLIIFLGKSKTNCNTDTSVDMRIQKNFVWWAFFSFFCAVLKKTGEHTVCPQCRTASLSLMSLSLIVSFCKACYFKCCNSNRLDSRLLGPWIWENWTWLRSLKALEFDRRCGTFDQNERTTQVPQLFSTDDTFGCICVSWPLEGSSLLRILIFLTITPLLCVSAASAWYWRGVMEGWCF